MIRPDELALKTISTDRLLLRDFLDTDLASFYELYSDHESSLLDDWEPLENMEQAKRKRDGFQNQARKKTGVVYAIADIISDAFIGCAGLFDFDYDSCNCGIFYQILASQRKKGYATEAVRGLTRYGFETLKLHRIFAYITPGNDPSIRVMEKCGYINEGLLREMEFYKGRYWDGIAYAMIENDYLGIRQS